MTPMTKKILKPSFGPVDLVLYPKVGKFQQMCSKKSWTTALPYAVPYEFIPFETSDGEPAGDYNDLVYHIYLGQTDQILWILRCHSRSPAWRMIVPIQDDGRKNAWIFMKPLQMDLWLTIGVFFIFTGFVVWVLEHRENKQFRGPPSKQVGMIFWGEVSQQLIKVCGNRVGFCGASTYFELYSELNINVNSRKAATQCYRYKGPQKKWRICWLPQWITSDSLNLESFTGLFLVASTSLISTLVIFLSTFLYNNRVILASNESSIWQKLRAMSRAFDEEAEKSSDASKKTKPANEVMVVPSDCPQSPVTSNPQLVEWIFTNDDHVFTTTENNTPIHETLEIEVNEAKE
ncbi:hypothetical protein Vadar_024217 [Vaccinium darrowii]|uniref:Uncharacterized protein n=1 Tax=Vaccinium darrowii TaxID=229202 RepID=A0ACB7YYW7_9ERIC|nr:hypothetical protein Vadar_024217 [Vaccinium darrowii]